VQVPVDADNVNEPDDNEAYKIPNDFVEGDVGENEFSDDNERDENHESLDVTQEHAQPEERRQFESFPHSNSASTFDEDDFNEGESTNDNIERRDYAGE
jgi:hypothetical protein